MSAGGRKGRKRQRGLSLIEAAMALGVAAVVIGGALLLYNQAHSGEKTAEAIDQMHLIETGVRRFYGWQKFSNLDNTTIVRTKMVPIKMVTGPDGLKNSFGGTITVSAIDVNSIADAGFEVKFSEVPADSCVVLSTKDYGHQVGQIVVNDTVFDFTDGTAPTGTTASAACGNTPGTLSWRFYN
jgi:PilS N terminal/Prokaryotic N-terminal methylation motif